MKRLIGRRGLLGVAGVASFAAMVVTWRVRSETRGAQRELMEWQARVAGARAKLEYLRDERSEPSREQGELKQRVAQAEGKTSAIRKTKTEEEQEDELLAALAKKRGEFSEWILRTREDPAVQNAAALGQREYARRGNRRFFRDLSFSPQQEERWLDIETRRHVTQVDLETAARTLGLARDDSVVAAFHDQVERDYEMALKMEFGDATWAKWDEFRQERVGWNVAGGFGAMATMAGVPISAAQGEALARAIVAATQRSEEGGIKVPCAIDWPRVDTHAKAILSEAQWTLFRSAEAPGQSGGGARFIAEVNGALWIASRQDEAEATRKGEKRAP